MLQNPNYISNYDFVPYPAPKFYAKGQLGARQSEGLSGYMEIKLTCVDDVHIGSGFRESYKGSFATETMKCCGKPVIPASSLKGAIRTIARAVSSSCTPKPMENRKGDITERQGVRSIRCFVNPKENAKQLCITCDMFGAMSYGSKVDFSDLTSDDAKLEVVKLKQQHSPNFEMHSYSDNNGVSKGYKFYKTHCSTNNFDRDLNTEVIKSGSSFSGRIFFQKLSEQQLSLLLFSLGADNSILLKLGGFKNDGMGTVKIEVLKLNVGGKECDAAKPACDYADKFGSECAPQIAKLREILKP